MTYADYGYLQISIDICTSAIFYPSYKAAIRILGYPYGYPDDASTDRTTIPRMPTQAPLVTSIVIPLGILTHRPIFQGDLESGTPPLLILYPQPDTHEWFVFYIRNSLWQLCRTFSN